jgi:hypothetical protein
VARHRLRAAQNWRTVGKGQILWVACAGIPIIMAILVAGVVLSHTETLKQSNTTDTAHQQPVVGTQRIQRITTLSARFLPEWDSVPLAADEMAAIRLPVGAQSCFSERRPGGTWHPLAGPGLGVLTDQRGIEADIRVSAVSYVRALEPMELVYYVVPIGANCPS